LDADGKFGQVRANLGIEAIAIHPEVARSVAEADDPRRNV